MSGYEYILDTEVTVPSGINVELAIAVAQANIDLFSSYEADGETYTLATLAFLEQSNIFTKVTDILTFLLPPLLERLPTLLKPLPIILSVPSTISEHSLLNWIHNSQYMGYLSHITISHNRGNAFIEECLHNGSEPDAVICIAIDSLLDELDALIEKKKVMCKVNPWGIIPSEGGAGMVLIKKNVVDTLKLSPQSQIVFSQFDHDCSDRRGCSRLIRLVSKDFTHLGLIYSDMTNQRSQIEDYGFAIGARSEVMSHEQEVLLTNEYWGTIGDASGIATLATINALHPVGEIATAFLFDQHNSRGLLVLKKNK